MLQGLFLGSLLVIGSASVLGWQLGDRYRKRRQQLEDIRLALQVLITEIEYGQVPLPEALQQAAKVRPGIGSKVLFKTADILLEKTGQTPRDAWKEALNQEATNTVLHTEDIDILLGLSVSLGASNTKDQLRYFKLTIQRLERMIEEASMAEASGVRLFRYLGVLGGILLVLLSI